MAGSARATASDVLGTRGPRVPDRHGLAERELDPAARTLDVELELLCTDDGVLSNGARELDRVGFQYARNGASAGDRLGLDVPLNRARVVHRHGGGLHHAFDLTIHDDRAA